MRRLISLLLVLSLLPLHIFAVGHSLHYIHIDVCLYPDGSARVTEQRAYTIGDEGTEGYITMKNMGDIGVSDLRVQDEQGVAYEVDRGNWDVHRTRAQKKGHCGIHQLDDGVEICWGVGDSGMRIYDICYTLGNLVQGHPDYDGFNHSFYEAANTPARSATLTVRMQGGPLTWPSARIWAFGFEGEVVLTDSVMNVGTEQTMECGDALIVMMQFDKGIFHPHVQSDTNFSQVRTMALSNSDYPPYEEISSTDSLDSYRASFFGGDGFSGPRSGEESSVSGDNASSDDSDLGMWGYILAFITMILGFLHLPGSLSGGSSSGSSSGYRSSSGSSYRSRSSGGGGSSSRSGGGGHSGGGGSGIR